MEVKCGEREKNLWLIIFYLEKFFPQDEGPASDRTLHFCVNLAAHMLQSPNRKRVSVATESRTHGWKHGAFAGVRTGLLKCVVPDLVSLNSRFTCGLDTHTHTHAHTTEVYRRSLTVCSLHCTTGDLEEKPRLQSSAPTFVTSLKGDH